MQKNPIKIAPKTTGLTLKHTFKSEGKIYYDSAKSSYDKVDVIIKI